MYIMSRTKMLSYTWLRNYHSQGEKV